MSRLKRLIIEAHQRSLWQALLVYLGASFGVLGGVDLFIEYLGLPRWLIWAGLSLLVMGLPVVIVISLAKEEVYGDDVPAEHAEAAAEEDRRLRFLTWRTAGLALVGVLAVWGLIAASWVVLGGTGSLLTPAAAADFVDPDDCVVVAEFSNETDRGPLGATVRDAVVTDIGQSGFGYVTVLGAARLRETLGLMRLPDTTHVDQRLAVEIARRENCPAVVSGSVAPLGTGYSLTAAIIEVGTGAGVKRLNETAADETGVIDAVRGLAGQVRRHLGESLPSIRRSEPLSRYTTSSLEALELLTLGLRRWIVQGDRVGSIPFFEQAVSLDTAFAEAYRRLSSAYWPRDPVAVRRYAEFAYRFRERLPSREKLMAVPQYHWTRGRLDSALHYYRVGVERYPELRTFRHNLGFTLYGMGRFEEALQVRLDVAAMRDFYADGEVLSQTHRTLNQHALADSALAFLSEKLPPGDYRIAKTAAWNAYYAGDLLLADSLAREMANDSKADPAIGGRLLLAGSAALHGRVGRALALADSAAQLAFEVHSTGWPARWSLQLTEYASLAAGAPERALPHLEESRSRLTARTLEFEDHQLIGQVASGYALAGDVHSARDLLGVMDSLAAANDFHPTGIGEQVLAVIALQEGRAGDAVEHLRRARAVEFGLHRWEVRWLLAQARTALGQLDEAIAQYDTLTGTYRLQYGDLYWGDQYVSFPLRPWAHERLGSLYLEVGDTTAAARHLAAFIELWRAADPELQPRVQAAQARLEEILAERG
jgi:tetratricopeptide (TPR) repeat protein